MRKKYFVGTKTQITYFTLLFISMTLPSVILAIYFYYLVFNIVGTKLLASEMVGQSLFLTLDKIRPIIVLGLPAILVLLLIWGLLLSHRFAGPINRLMKELTEIAESGNFTRRLVVRKNDDLKDLVNCVNKVLEKAQQKSGG